MTHGIYERIAKQRLGRRKVLALAGSAGAGALLAACSGGSGGSDSPSAISNDTTSPGDTPAVLDGAFSDPAHANLVAPDYKTVFPSDRVPQLTIKVPAATWEAMLANMTTLFGARGTGGMGGFGGGQVQGGNGQAPGGFGQLPGNVPAAGQVPAGGVIPGGGGGGGMGMGMSSPNPDWVKGTIEFNGETWENVGVRFKGNSSLRDGWGSGDDDLPFKLDFDQWEDEVPEIKNQRFYGFKQLSLSNNFNDPTYIRETLAYDMLESAGLVAAETAVYEILLDRGEGPVRLGNYTVIEVIDDTVLARAFEDGSGNIYEADGSAASLANGTLGAIEASFQAEGGENPDWSDIKAFYEVIHSPTRTSDPAAWRSSMETSFDVESFLEWLAIAAAIQHWDTYGGMTHNYYLYNDPAQEKLVFVSWDHNLVLGAGGAGGGGVGGAAVPPAGQNQGGQNQGGFGGRGGAGGMRMNVSLDKKDVNESWPLIRYLLDQEVYYDKYTAYLKQTAETLFAGARPESQVDALAAVIKPALPAEQRDAYQQAVDSLKTSIQTRRQAVSDFLATL